MSHLPGPGQNKAADEEVAELSLHVILGPAFVPFVLMLMSSLQSSHSQTESTF